MPSLSVEKPLAGFSAETSALPALTDSKAVRKHKAKPLLAHKFVRIEVFFASAEPRQKMDFKCPLRGQDWAFRICNGGSALCRPAFFERKL